MRLTYIEHPFLIDQISKDGKHMDCKEQTGNYEKDLIEEAIEKLWEYENLGEPNTIEALQQEYDELDTGHSKLFKAYCEMKQENERLQAQNGVMRGALKQARETLSGVNVARCPYCWGKDTHHKNCDIKRVIGAIDALLGGKDDV